MGRRLGGLSGQGGVCAVEWSENVQKALEGAMTVSIEKLDENTQRITIDQG